jgi:hypothetical protein
VFATGIQGPTAAGQWSEGRQPGRPDPGDLDTIKQILYRVEPPNRPEFVGYRSPDGLNELIAIDIRERREAESKPLRSEYLIGIPSSFTVAIGILGVYFAKSAWQTGV